MLIKRIMLFDTSGAFFFLSFFSFRFLDFLVCCVCMRACVCVCVNYKWKVFRSHNTCVRLVH